MIKSLPGWLLASLSALTLCACATVQRLDAAGDVHALLISIRDNDQAAFDTHVDRPALKRQIESIAVSQARRRDPTGLAALLAPALADVAGDLFVQPRVFRLVAEHYGYRPDMKIPGPFAIATMLKPLPDGRVCATREKDGPCLLIFTREGDGWKLSGFEGDPGMLRLRP